MNTHSQSQQTSVVPEQKKWLVKRTTHTHTLPFYGPLSETTRVGRYQKRPVSEDIIQAW